MRLILGLFLAIPAVAGNRYEITAAIDSAASVVHGTTLLTYTNDTPSPLESIPILCSGTMSRITRISGPDLKFVPDQQLKLERAVLDRPLAPGGSLTLEILFSSPYPTADGYRRVSRAWHPKAVVFREGSFQPDESRADDYDVRITAPTEEVVTASGKLLEEADAGPDKTRHYAATAITNYGIASSRQFQQFVSEAGGVTIRSFYLPGGEKWGTRLAEYASRIISFYQKLFGFYPHEALSIIPGSKSSRGGFPVASGIIVIHDTLDANVGEVYAQWITSHEIAHQYWGFDTLIDSATYHHWPGLPLGIYTDRLYTEAFNPKSNAHRGYIDTYLGAIANGNDTTIYRTSEELDKLPFDANNIIEHGKSYAVIQMLEEVMGKENFLQFVRLLQQRYRGRYLSPQAFEAVAAEAYGASLDWFFRQWVHENKVMCYEIASVETSGNQARVTVQPTGDALMPVSLEVVFEDGSKARKLIGPQPQVQVVSFPADSKAVRAQLDPDNHLALFSPEAGHIWGRKVRVTNVRMPDELTWGTNVALVSLKNGDIRPHELMINIQSNVPHRGYGWQTKHTVPAGGELTVERPFIIGPFPGSARVRVQVMDTTDNAQVGWRQFTTEFPFTNTRIRPLDVPEPIRSWPSFKKPSYPPLRMSEHGPFVFYTLASDAWTEAHLAAIANRRRRAYAEIAKLLNPRFQDRVAIYLFPDADSKLAYTSHTGMGWAPGGNILVEIINEREYVDPNHELVHIIAASIGRPAAMWNEGLAAYLQEEHKWDGYHVDAWAKAFQAQGTLWRLADLSRFDEIGSPQSKAPIAYPEAASVVEYLIDRYGWDKFLQSYREVKATNVNEKMLAIFGASIEEIEKAWLARLAAMAIQPAPMAQHQ